MRGVWRSAPAVCRLLATGVFLGALALLLLPSSAFAQSGVGRAINTATGRSLDEANEKNQQDAMIGQGSGTTVGTGAIGAAVIPTGRLKKADHDELKGQATGEGNFAWDTREASVFANGVYVMPGVVMGGQVKVGVFGGENWVSIKMKNGGDDTLDLSKGQHGSALNKSTLFGTSLLWANAKGMYAMANIVGFVGKTTMKDAIDDCGVATCDTHRYAFGTSGFTSALTTGNVFKLSNSPTGPFLDVRGVAAYTQNIGEQFIALNGAEQEYKFSTWTLTGSATLFSNITLQNSALLRPYIQGYVRQEVGYNNKLKVDDPGNGFFGYVHYDQAHTYGGVDVGLTYELGKMTFGAATYYEASGDERTWGGRLGASWKLN